MQQKSNKLNVWLIRDQFKDYDQIVESTDNSKSVVIPDVGTFYYEVSNVRRPDWLHGFFGYKLDLGDVFKTASSKALLLMRSPNNPERIFAITFGHGRYLLRDGVIEDRFGLKVVLNSLNPDTLKSIDRTSLGSIPKNTREQINKEGAASSFGIDIDQDLMKQITGRSRYSELGQTISGRDALTISVNVNSESVVEFLDLCFERYNSEEYKVNFDWFDHIKHEKNPSVINSLDDILLEKITSSDLDKVWMVAPDIIDWVDVDGFSYGSGRKADKYNDLNINEFIPTLKVNEINIDKIKSRKIRVYSSNNGELLSQWSAYKCIYAELEHLEKVYILNNGIWYCINNDFKDIIFNNYNQIENCQIDFPLYKNNIPEDEYNITASKYIDGTFCADKKLINYGGGHSKIEFCDLYTSDKKIIHVKRYGGSAQLSHLFAQGVVSGELFVSDKDFREKLNKILPHNYQLDDFSQKPDASEYEVVFAIISKSAKALDIPFFSKVTIRNAQKRLEGFGYKVTIKKIEYENAAPLLA